MKNHEGVSHMEIFNNGDTLKGYYYSNPRDRGYYGTFELKRVSKKHLNCFRKEELQMSESI